MNISHFSIKILCVVILIHLFKVMKGEYDKLLTFPFKFTAQLKLDHVFHLSVCYTAQQANVL